MKKYVLVANSNNELVPRMYLGNILLIKYNEENYQHYLEENGSGYFTIKKIHPDAPSINQVVRCPDCSSKLLRVSQNIYNCVICNGK